jgi:hypothetical protein
MASYLFELLSGGPYQGPAFAGGVGVIALTIAMREWPRRIGPAVGVILASAIGVLAAERRFGGALLIASLTNAALRLTRRVVEP